MTHPKVLIVGANGKTGRRVQTRLSAAGIETRGVSRSSNPSFDWTAPETWAPALEGMDSAYLTYHPDLSVPDAQEHIRIFCEMAATAGLDHVVLLSGRNEAGAQRAEQVFRSSGLTWNIIQASWFAQNFSEDFMVEGILSGQFMVPEGTAGEPFIDIDDIADVAVATLMEPGLHNRLYEVTGPRVLSFADCIREISAATGDTVELIELPLEDYIRALREQAAPEYLIALLPDLFSQLFDGRSAHTAHGVREALGRPATGPAGHRLLRIHQEGSSLRCLASNDRRGGCVMPAAEFTALAWVMAILSGLMAGIYATFSTVIMKSLATLAPDSAIEVMNAINRTILRTAFMPLFFASTLIGLLLIVKAIWYWSEPGAGHALAIGLIYVVGMFISTAAVNVPLNNALARVTDDASEAGETWNCYLVQWTRWNTSRAIACALTL